MNRIEYYFSNYRVTLKPDDFVSLNANIILDKHLIYNRLTKDGQVMMLLPGLIDQIAQRYGVKTNIKSILLDFVRNLPEQCWQEIKSEFQLYSDIK